MPGFGEEVKRLREASGLTQHALADKSGVSRPFIASIERGTRTRLGADLLYALCDALGVSCDHFRPFLGAEPPPPPPEVPPAAPPAKRKGKP